MKYCGSTTVGRVVPNAPRDDAFGGLGTNRPTTRPRFVTPPGGRAYSRAAQFALPVQRAACALPFEGSVPSRINRNHPINQISTPSFYLSHSLEGCVPLFFHDCFVRLGYDRLTHFLVRQSLSCRIENVKHLLFHRMAPTKDFEMIRECCKRKKQRERIQTPLLFIKLCRCHLHNFLVAPFQGNRSRNTTLANLRTQRLHDCALFDLCRWHLHKFIKRNRSETLLNSTEEYDS